MPDFTTVYVRSTVPFQDEDEEELEEWVKTTSYRLLVCLGDLSMSYSHLVVKVVDAVRAGLKGRGARGNFYRWAPMT